MTGSRVLLNILVDDWDAVAEAATSQRSVIAVSTLQMRRGAARAAWKTLADAGQRGAAHRNAELVVALVAPYAVGTPSAQSRESAVEALRWRGVWDALRGDTASARRDLQRLRDLLPGTYRGAAPAFIAALIAARAQQWDAVIETLGPVTRGREYGRWQQDGVVGPVPIRWLMAEAYLRVGKPDSAIVIYERVLKPDAGTLSHLALRGLVRSLAQQRLATLRYGGGSREAADRHAVAFTNAFTEPDRELVPLLEALDVARAELASRGGGSFGLENAGPRR